VAGFYSAATQRPDATAPWPTISPPHTRPLTWSACWSGKVCDRPLSAPPAPP